MQSSRVDQLPFLKWMTDLNADTLRADFIAALTGAVMVLPQAIAFSSIAGLPIEHGFYTAIVTTIIAALFGSSRQMVSGPTTAISVLVFSSLSLNFEAGSAAYVQAAILLALMAGAFQLVLGLLKLGRLSSFVSPSVMFGFSTGAAVIIFVSQLPSALGIDGAKTDSVFSTIAFVVKGINETNSTSLVIAALSFSIALFVYLFLPRLPNYLVALTAAIGLSSLLGAREQDVEFVRQASAYLPSFSVPQLQFEELRTLAQSAFAIALVGLLEATAISRSLAIKSGQDVNINTEFVGQGLSNIVGSFFSCYMGSGSFTRSAMNYDAGAKTPLSAILSSILLFLILSFVGGWIDQLPIPAISGMIILVAFRLVEVEHIKQTLKTSRSSTAVMTLTFVSTLVIGLEGAILLGTFVSLAFYLHKTAKPFLAIVAPDPSSAKRFFRQSVTFALDQCPQLCVGRIDGQLYFGSLDALRLQLRALERDNADQKHLLILMKGLADIDLPGAELLIEEDNRRRARGGKLYITAREAQLKPFGKLGLIDALGSESVFPNKDEAIEQIIGRLNRDTCENCPKRIFRECAQFTPILKPL